MDWWWIAIAFVSFWFLRSIYYWLKLKTIIKFKAEYQNYLSQIDNNLLQHRSQIVSLLKEANVKDFVIPHIEPVGFGRIAQGNMSGLSNIHLIREEVVIPYMMKFDEAIGFFRHNMKQSFNPFYWFEFLILLPEKIIKYVCSEPPDAFMKVIQLLYWGIMILVGLHGVKIIDLTQFLK